MPRLDPAEQLFFEKLQTLLNPKQQLRRKRRIKKVCGVDAAYIGDHVKAVASLMDAKGRLVEQADCEGRATFPYISGLFFLREGPFVTEAVRKLAEKPDLVCFDAHGLAHPRNRGLATICGMVLGIPSLGIAKSKLVGEIQTYKPGLNKLVYQETDIGFVTEKPRRFWSPAFDVSMLELEAIILEFRTMCISSILASHNSSRSLKNHDI